VGYDFGGEFILDNASMEGDEMVAK